MSCVCFLLSTKIGHGSGQFRLRHILYQHFGNLTVPAIGKLVIRRACKRYPLGDSRLMTLRAPCNPRGMINPKLVLLNFKQRTGILGEAEWAAQAQWGGSRSRCFKNFPDSHKSNAKGSSAIHKQLQRDCSSAKWSRCQFAHELMQKCP